MDTTPDVRVLTANDAESFWNLRLEGIRCEPAAFRESEAEHAQITIEVTRQRLHQTDADFVIGVFRETALVGTVGFHRDQGEKVRHKALVWGVYLTPNARGLGFARRMFDFLLETARKIEDLTQLYLHVADTQFVAQRFYESIGFEKCGTEPHSLKITDRYVSEHLMVLRL